MVVEEWEESGGVRGQELDVVVHTLFAIFFSTISPIVRKENLLLKSNTAGPGLIHAFSSFSAPVTPFAFCGNPFVSAAMEAIMCAPLLLGCNLAPEILLSEIGLIVLELEVTN